MIDEEKQLLLTALCGYLPYGVQCEFWGHRCRPYTFTGNDIEDLIAGRTIKPYLRPMSSMTEEEKGEFDGFVCIDEEAWNGDSIQGFINQAEIMSDGIDWLNENMFDYRGLIPMGLALEAPKEMYKTE